MAGAPKLNPPPCCTAGKPVTISPLLRFQPRIALTIGVVAPPDWETPSWKYRGPSAVYWTAPVPVKFCVAPGRPGPVDARVVTIAPFAFRTTGLPPLVVATTLSGPCAPFDKLPLRSTSCAANTPSPRKSNEAAFVAVPGIKAGQPGRN